MKEKQEMKRGTKNNNLPLNNMIEEQKQKLEGKKI